ncbi:alkaline phosphatase family protein [Ruegeria sp. 2205SS24-7]|uniref:alkaline phosphatase family protein n=1 Tax=Ruegeria discodermiae TaxID=3064389 RepID=UPI0027403446|nr:alkaline phosphatase family protein [Ruegeria sp. 2205SS24-7]MDP5217174.1 alkaline phosphatase family protein [Ruegeria sp. 2205SS24-7]
MADAKNVLFIIIDQLRADCLSGALAAHVELPNLRAFMEDAVSFERHFSVTNPCGPSRASILTGQYAMNHRSIRNGTPLRHDTPNIATEMRKLGYLPMLFGYTDTSQDPRAFAPGDPALSTYEFPMPGFHEMTEMRLEMSYPWRSHLMAQGYAFDRYCDVYRPVSPGGTEPRLTDPALYRAEHSDTAFLTDSFLGKMRGYCGESWFAHLTYIRPHPPLVAPAPYNEMYDPVRLPLPQRMDHRTDEEAIHPFIAPALEKGSISGMVEGFGDLEASDEAVQSLRAIYLGLASEVDTHIGRVIEFLKSSGQYENTLVVITADHGEMLGDRHCWGKSTIYDAAYHTPLILHCPDNAENAGRRVTLPTESIDVTPTILDWMGATVPNSMDGRSLLPLVYGETPESWRRHTYSELDFSNPLEPSVAERALGTGPSDSSLCILREDRFTLVEFAADLPPVLFDHEGDGEMRNVATRPEYQGDLARLTRAMLRHRMRNADQTLALYSITGDGPKLRAR